MWEEPLTVPLPGSLTLHTSPLPGSGAVLAYILNILKHYNFEPEDETDPVTYQRIVEAFKWGYGRRSELGEYYSVQ